jgi:NAD(P)-dependent dehydrogenase (short-subunit alcohol dehydrogenase family)
VNAVAPGPILLPEGAGEELAEAVTRATPLARLGGPDAVAEAVLFLLAHDFMTGETIRVDGGRSLK